MRIGEHRSTTTVSPSVPVTEQKPLTSVQSETKPTPETPSSFDSGAELVPFTYGG